MRDHFVLAAWSASALLLSAAPGWAQQQAGGYFGPHMWANGGDGWFGPLFMIALIVVSVALLALLARWIRTCEPAGAAPRSPLEILKERFARGEIDRAEYDERRRVLTQ